MLARSLLALVLPRAVTQLTTAQIDAFAPYTNFARAAYCASTSITNWACGSACTTNTGFTVSTVGGDGNDVQLYYIGYWADQQTVVVAHEGTDPTQILSVATDVNAFLTSLNSTLFPGLPSGVSVHNGFGAAQAVTADVVYAQVTALLAAHSAQSVTLVGHSLGGAIAELDALMFSLRLPSTVSVKAVTYGTPRVGNPTYAAFYDQTVADFTRINHASDPVPIVPGRGLGYQHPSGEVHLVSDTEAVSCPGRDDATDALCTIESVPNLLESDVIDHLGPYPGDLFMGTALGDCL